MIIDFNDQRTWPADVLQYLEQNHNLFLAWENSPGSISGQQYDKALRDLRAVLNQHRLHGYHCTRLTRAEINHIVSDGMQLPNAAMLRARVQAVQDDGLIEASIAKRLAEENQADDSNRAQRICFCSNRAQRICFCFFPPCLERRQAVS